jgi:hypothetical protein
MEPLITNVKLHEMILTSLSRISEIFNFSLKWVKEPTEQSGKLYI